MSRVKRAFLKVFKINFRHYLALSLIAASVLFSVFRYELSFIRLWQNLCDLFNSIVFYFSKTFLGEETVVTVTEIPDVDLAKYLSFDIETFFAKFDYYWEYFFTWKNFANYCMFFFKGFSIVLSALSILIPVYMLISMLVKRAYLTPSDEEDKFKDTRQLVFFKAKIEPFLLSAFNTIKSIFSFIYEKKIYFKTLVFIWLLNLNAITILVGVLAYYFYLISAFNFTSFFVAFAKLLLDLVIMIDGASFVFWLVAVYWLITRALKKRAYFNVRKSL